MRERILTAYARIHETHHPATAPAHRHPGRPAGPCGLLDHPAVRPRRPARHDLRRQRRTRAGRRPRDPGRPDRGRRLGRRGARPPGDRRHRARRRARLHQHAQPLGRIADPGPALAERDPRGRDARGVRRDVDGAAQRADEAGSARPAGRPQVRHHLGHAAPVPRPAAEARHGAQRRLFRRRVDRARLRTRPGQPRADAGGTRADEGARRPGDARGRSRPDDGTDLHTRGVCRHRRADRAVEGGREIRRHLHRAHEKRGRPLSRGHRRDACASPGRRRSASRSFT